MSKGGRVSREPLKLRAIDSDDLDVLGAFLQDALVPVCDMQFIPNERRFLLVANRFCWERVDFSEKPADGAQKIDGIDEKPVFERVLCGITFENVEKTKIRGFSQAAARDDDQILEVLDIQVEGNALTLIFSGDAAVCLEVAGIDIFAQDMGEFWPTLRQPHPPDEDAP